MTSAQAKILVTFDGSDASRTVFDSAVRLARRMQAGIVLLRVHSAPRDVWVDPDAAKRQAELDRLQALWLAELQAEAGSMASRYGIEVEACSRMLGKRWNVAGEILAVADEYDVELICMATHGESSVRHFFVGSTALDVVGQSKRPVTLVRVEDEK